MILACVCVVGDLDVDNHCTVEIRNQAGLFSQLGSFSKMTPHQKTYSPSCLLIEIPCLKLKPELFVKLCSLIT